MRLGQMALIGYVIFLGAYAWWKYSAAAPPEFSAGYAQSVAILILLTGVAPFVFTLMSLKALPLRRFAASVLGVILGIGFCVAGYAAFGYFFIAGNSGAPAMLDVAMRGIGWGALQGGLAAISSNH